MSDEAKQLRELGSIETSQLFSQREKLNRAADALDAKDARIRELEERNEVLRRDRERLIDGNIKRQGIREKELEAEVAYRNRALMVIADACEEARKCWVGPKLSEPIALVEDISRWAFNALDGKDGGS